jgi:hypothetical protein
VKIARTVKQLKIRITFSLNPAMNSTSSVYNTIRRGTNGTIKTCFGQFVVSRYTSHSGLAFTFTLTRLLYSFSFFLLSMIDRLRLATYISISDKVRASKPFTNCISLYFFACYTRLCWVYNKHFLDPPYI